MTQQVVSLRAWTNAQHEGWENKTLTRLNRPSDFCKTKGGPVAVISNWERLIQAQTIPAFVDFAVANNLEVADIQGFIEGWERFSCGRVVQRQTDARGQTVAEVIIKGREIWLPSVERETFDGRKALSLGPYNPYLNFYKTKGAVSRTLRNLESLKLETVYDITLTFPSEVSVLLPDNGAEITERGEKCVKSFYSWLGKMIGGKIAACVNLHPWRSSDTLPHLHAHSLLLGSYVKGKVGEGEVLRIKPSWFLDYMGIAGQRKGEGTFTRLIKKKWAGIVNKEFNTSYEALDVHLEFIELRDQYGNERDDSRARLNHKLKYNRRRPISDLASYYLENDFKPEKNNPLWADFLIHYDNRPLTLGYWNRMSKLAVVAKEEIEPHGARCPFCGKQLHYEGFHKGAALPPHVLRVSITKNNKFYLFKGPPEC
jgi:hypothetical protein